MRQNKLTRCVTVAFLRCRELMEPSTGGLPLALLSDTAQDVQRWTLCVSETPGTEVAAFSIGAPRHPETAPHSLSEGGAGASGGFGPESGEVLGDLRHRLGALSGSLESLCLHSATSPTAAAECRRMAGALHASLDSLQVRFACVADLLFLMDSRPNFRWEMQLFNGNNVRAVDRCRLLRRGTHCRLSLRYPFRSTLS